MPPGTDSTPPKAKEELTRLKRELKERDAAAISQRFRRLEKKLEEVETMAEHQTCNKDNEFSMIRDSFTEGKEEFKGIKAWQTKHSTIRFYTILGGIGAFILSAIVAAYMYGQNETKWSHTKEKVDQIEITTKEMDSNVRGIVVSFRLMEQQQTQTQKKLAEVTPENIEKAVTKGILNAR